MKAPIIATLLLLTTASVGQDKDPTVVSICDLLRSPESFSGKMVRVSGDAMGPRALQVHDADCGRISIAYTENPDLKPKPRFKTVRDRNFHEFESNLGVLIPPPPERRTGLNCTPGRLTITVDGRFDSSYAMRNGRRVQVSSGFGHMGLFEYRLVLLRVIALDAKKPSCRR